MRIFQIRLPLHLPTLDRSHVQALRAWHLFWGAKERLCMPVLYIWVRGISLPPMAVAVKQQLTHFWLNVLISWV